MFTARFKLSFAELSMLSRVESLVNSPWIHRMSWTLIVNFAYPFIWIHKIFIKWFRGTERCGVMEKRRLNSRRCWLSLQGIPILFCFFIRRIWELTITIMELFQLLARDESVVHSSVDSVIHVEVRGLKFNPRRGKLCHFETLRL